MLCPHCSQGVLRQETSHFTSNLNPSEVNGYEGMTCKICGYWADVIVVVKPELPVESNNKKNYNGTYQKSLTKRIEKKVLKYYEYIDFLRNNGYSWNHCSAAIQVSRTTLFRIYNEIKSKGGLK